MDSSIGVILPIYKNKFNKEEIISLKKLRENLSRTYPIYIITHQEIIPNIKSNPLLRGYIIKKFDKKFFNYQGYNKLLKSEVFYNSFKNLNYILIYQTDCLVFRSSLEYWVNKKMDYVGSPWLKKDSSGKIKLLAVGNGGLSLRKISSFIKVTKKKKTPKNKLTLFFKNLIPSMPIIFHKLFINRDYPKYHLGCRNEDIFWSYAAKQLQPSFKVADYKDALKFSFEKYPRFCFNENNKKLPFGCHAWQKYDKAFWKKFI